MVDRISKKKKVVKNKKWSEVKWWEVLYGSEKVHYFGNKFGDENCTVSSLVMWGETEG